MGGYFSGRRANAKDLTSHYRCLDVQALQSHGALADGLTFEVSANAGTDRAWAIRVRAEADSVVLLYKQRRLNEEWKAEDYPVAIAWTPCHFGGSRAWFRCPREGCARRVRFLYGGATFACRQCYRLAYRSQREGVLSRAISRASVIRERLDGSRGTIDPFPARPKGMHERTYERLKTDYTLKRYAAFQITAKALGIQKDDPLA